MKRRRGNHLKSAGGAAVLACAATTLAAADVSTNTVTGTAGPASTPLVIEKPGATQPQNWNVHVQNTDIVQGYPGFHAAYPGPNSLPSGGETRESISLDVMAGVRLWRGAEAHVDGLMWQGFGVGDSLGAEGFPNGEAFRLGTDVPNGNITRLFIRQIINLGGDEEPIQDDDFDLAGLEDVSRITLTLGRFSAKDIFDNNAYANDPRAQFMNWGLMANEAWDYPADAIGYTTGLAIELNKPKWTLRYGFFQVPHTQNSLTAEDAFLKWPYDGASQDGQFLKSWGMVTELERRYSIESHPGTLRLLAFVNRADMAEYSSATAILRAGGDFTTARAYNYKYGFGLNWEQEIAKDVGIFSRLGWNDDQEEGWMFSDVGYAGSLGLSVNGDLWHRPGDTFALAGLMNGLSEAARQFFQAGGTGILAGDGNLNYGLEKIVETYYNFQIWQTIHASVDYQFIDNPAFNRDRGPVSVFSGRLHWEF
jgi:high affinity Mn2+ porin